MLSGSRSATIRRPAASPPDTRSILRALADSVVAVLLAPVCAACGDPLERPTSGPVCQTCWNAIVPINPPLCPQCGDPLPGWRVLTPAESRCGRCRQRKSPVSEARAIGPYDGTLRAILHAFKYDRRQSLAQPLARRMLAGAGGLLAGVDVAVPVPLHRRRRRSRGFNQAAELARHLGLPCCNALRRTRATPSQTDLPAAQRHANVRNAFALRRRPRLAGLTVLLVDDVSTTGATLEACARELRLAGVREVRALTAARVVSRAP